MIKLRAKLGELTVENVLAASDATIQECICKVGFWRRKTGYIRQTAQKLKDEFDSDVPKTVDELCSLPGVGPKMAYLALQVAWNLNLGIGVDVHVHRITNRLGWHKPPTTTPEQTRLNLQSWLPKELHPEINPLLVGFGQVICQPVGPKCDSCVLSTRGLCPSAVKAKAKSRAKGTPTKAKTLKRSLTEVMKEEGVELERIDQEEDGDQAMPGLGGEPDEVGPKIKVELP
ncbi:DNA N-glycosylase and apurinic/apyrimidinic (AP) lyase [Tulasnella sp. 427]|nr:DNA N-glycosylase and apurinic/apyrimidinic (AP) lyase [Tulasnella sp. 427]